MNAELQKQRRARVFQSCENCAYYADWANVGAACTITCTYSGMLLTTCALSDDVMQKSLAERSNNNCSASDLVSVLSAVFQSK